MDRLFRRVLISNEQHLQRGRDDRVMASSGGMAMVSLLHATGMLRIICKWCELSEYEIIITSAAQIKPCKKKKEGGETGHFCYSFLHPLGSWKTHMLSIDGISNRPALWLSFEIRVLPCFFAINLFLWWIVQMYYFFLYLFMTKTISYEISCFEKACPVVVCMWISALRSCCNPCPTHTPTVLWLWYPILVQDQL